MLVRWMSCCCFGGLLSSRLELKWELYCGLSSDFWNRIIHYQLAGLLKLLLYDQLFLLILLGPRCSLGYCTTQTPPDCGVIFPFCHQGGTDLEGKLWDCLKADG